MIDNLSSEPLTTNWDLTWHPNARHVFEGELGLSAARRRGIRESSAAIIVFVDDDNVLDEHYLSTVLCIGMQWPGTWGSGATKPEFEVRPSEAVKALLPYLALRDTRIAQWGNVGWEPIPNGAGLCVRREIAKEYCRLSEVAAIQITGRKGKSLTSYEDVEISYVARHNGLGSGVFPELKLIHLIPKERVSEDNLLRLYRGAATCYFLLKYNWEGSIPGNPFRPRGLLSILKNCLTKHDPDRPISVGPG